MNWVALIPTSLLQLGGLLLFIGCALVFLDVPGKGVPWDKIGAGFCAAGGFGVGGAAGGAVGAALGSTADLTLTTSQRLAGQAIGASITGGVFAVLGLWVWSRIKGKGLATSSKLKSLVLGSVLAVAGTILAAVPGLYAGVNQVYTEASTTVVTSLRSS